MPADTLKIKERLTANGNSTEAQADDIIEALLQADDSLVTKNFLRAELRSSLLRGISIQTGINGFLLALFGYVLSLILA